MIFDSCSFISEYLHIARPSLFTGKRLVEPQLNEFGIKALACHQNAESIDQIEQFIIDIIENRPDPMRQAKDEFYAHFILKYNTPTPSANIINYLRKALVNDRT